MKEGGQVWNLGGTDYLQMLQDKAFFIYLNQKKKKKSNSLLLLMPDPLWPFPTNSPRQFAGQIGEGEA